ncbi:hypothetical protein [Micromonospora sp. NPDC006431]|uniref:hypothetical protein n=1 Tax=Micromonospora sp. NPDC006431 TaxID=3364235 RepID=UPI00367B45CA
MLDGRVVLDSAVLGVLDGLRCLACSAVRVLGARNARRAPCVLTVPVAAKFGGRERVALAAHGALGLPAATVRRRGGVRAAARSHGA